MVCDRCKMVVKTELEKQGIVVIQVELGEVTIDQDISSSEKQHLNSALEGLGFSLIDDKRSRVVEAVKTSIIDLVYGQAQTKLNLSGYISDRLHLDYNYVSNLYSDIEGSTIEKYYIAQKIERVKELLVYDEMSLSQIAFALNYSSAAHLSAQFKKVTGLTPSHFKQIGSNRRKSLDKI